MPMNNKIQLNEFLHADETLIFNKFYFFKNC